MATTPGRAPRSATPSGSTAQRGIILVLIAVAIGAMLLVKGGGDQTAKAEGSEVLSGDGGGGKTTEETTSTIPTTLVAPAQLKVVVVNATGTTGVAKTKGQELQGKGYPNTSWITATANSPTTVVYFAPDAQAESTAVAAALGLDAAVVQPLPSPPPGTDKGIDADAKTVVFVGSDLAGG